MYFDNGFRHASLFASCLATRKRPFYLPITIAHKTFINMCIWWNKSVSILGTLSLVKGFLHLSIIESVLVQQLWNSSAKPARIRALCNYHHIVLNLHQFKQPLFNLRFNGLTRDMICFSGKVLQVLASTLLKVFCSWQRTALLLWKLLSLFWRQLDI